MSPQSARFIYAMFSASVMFVIFRLNMEHMLLSRALWTSDSKCVPPHPGDAFASVHITHELPAGAAFGPCVLHNGFYDTIAFIALKARDNRNNCYAFRVRLRVASVDDV